MCMSADDAQWRICADDVYLMRRCAFGVYDARMRILRRLCADAHCAHVLMCGAAQRVHLRSMRICACALLRRMRRGRDPRGKAPNALFPFVFSSGRANPSKSKDYRAPTRKLLLNDIREAYHCHTLQSDAARSCTPEGVKSATHAQRRNS